MKTLCVGLFILTLFCAVGCTQKASDVPEATAPATRQPSAGAVKTVVNKPIPGEASGTFSLSVPFEPVGLKQGEDEAVRIGINRGEDFGEQVSLELSGLPAGVTVEAADPIIKQGSTGVTISLKAAADAALGDFTIQVTGHTASSGADFSEEFKLTVAQK